MALKQVFWDWNGTLLDDLEYAMGVRNRSFPAFGLPPIHSVADYHRQFTFPVRLYYQRAGVTDELFDDVAHAWMAEYIRGEKSVPLHPDALSSLERFKAAGLKQVILSASHKDVLMEQLAIYGLESRFDAILALGDIYAGSKEAVGQKYLLACGIAPESTVMLGDTLHDAEVAKAMGTQCLLIARGHQSRESLLQAGVPVLDTLAQATDWVLERA